jgi:hypothetical protein
LIHSIRAHGLEPYTISDGEATPRDWISEISGNDCINDLAEQTRVVQNAFVIHQQQMNLDESDADNGEQGGTATPRSTQTNSVLSDDGAGSSFEDAGMERGEKRTSAPVPSTVSASTVPEWSAERLAPARTPAEARSG